MPANNIARWDGVTWHAMGDPLSAVIAIVERPNGEVVVGTSYASVLSWNGSAWSGLGSIHAMALAVLPNGDLVAGGRGPGPKVLRYTGGNWSALGSGLVGLDPWESVDALRVLGNGDLIAAGSFGSSLTTPPSHVARWDGVAWTVLGQDVPTHATDIDVLPNGDLLVTHVGRDLNSQPHVSPSRWNGATWTPLPGIDAAGWQSANCLALTGDGEMFVAGTFGGVQGVATGGLASLFTGCPALAVPAGAGCVGGAGLVVLGATHLPWLGSTFAARTTGLPASSLALGVYGFASVSIPLASILPQGVPGCSLLATPDLLTLHLPAAGSVITALPIPNTAALIGAVLHHQVAPVELGAGGAITGVTSSNALTLTIGAL